MTSPEGLLLVDKPSGPTSHDIVALARKVLGTRRVGHTGTLDPMATGLLVLVVGRATRLARFVPGAPKRYEGEIRLGVITDTDDETGEVLSRHAGPLPGAGAVHEAAATLTGMFPQRPPRVSARSVGGTRLYRLARRGTPVDGPSRPVAVHHFTLTPAAEGLWAFDAEVSPGTYVRSLARDLGEALGCGGTLARLRRTAIGPFDVRRAVALSRHSDPAEIGAAVLPLESMPLTCPATVLREGDAERFLRGVPVALPESPPQEGGQWAAHGPEGRLLGIGTAREDRLHPTVVLPAPDPGDGLPRRNGL